MSAETTAHPPLIRHGGLVLSVYPTRQVVWHKRDLPEAAKKAQAGNRPSFVRVVRMPEMPGFRLLSSLVSEAKRDLTRIAELTGTTVVNYSLGVSPLPDDLSVDERRLTQNNLLPRGHGLVAEVDVICDAARRLTTSNANSILHGLMRYKKDDNGTHFIPDMFKNDPVTQMRHISEQFTEGSPREPSQPRSIYLTDIDHYVFPRT
jgi:hypothetical protein